MHFTSGEYDSFLVITDSTVTAEAFADVKGVTGAVPAVGGTTIEGTENWYWTDRVQQTVDMYGADVKVWFVAVKPAYMDIRHEYGRFLTRSVDGVYDVMWVDYAEYGYGRWDGRFSTGFTSSGDDATASYLQQLAIERRAAEFHAQWQADVKQWEGATDLSGMTAEEQKAARQAAGLLTDYEMVLEAVAYTEEIAALYEEGLLGFCEPDFEVDMRFFRFDGVTVWAGIGDCNLDGAVNAQDAASVLECAAAIGAGGTGMLSEEAQERCDINDDARMDALDASLILRYAAAGGSGEIVGWGTVL